MFLLPSVDAEPQSRGNEELAAAQLELGCTPYYGRSGRSQAMPIGATGAAGGVPGSKLRGYGARARLPAAYSDRGGGRHGDSGVDLTVVLDAERGA